MQNSSLVALSRQVALGRELEVIANNIANINTSGFKADGSIFEEYVSPTARTGAAFNNKVSYVRDRGTWHDLSQGPLERTGAPLDLAIDGKGFLVVQTPRGERYTRNGSLQIGPTGTLMTAGGFPVLGTSGPITLQNNDRDILVDPDGTVHVRADTTNNDALRGQLRVVSFDDNQTAQLTKDGDNTFAAPNDVTPADDKTAKVVQGAVEKSNVRSVVEMTRMIDVTRSYSQVAAVLQQQSDMRTSAIDKLADVPA